MKKLLRLGKKILTLHSPEKDFFSLDKLTTSRQIMKLRGYEVIMNYGILSLETIAHSDIIVLFCSRVNMKASELFLLEAYIQQGGKLFFTMSEHKGKSSKSNVNVFLEKFGIAFNSDSVIRTSRYGKYFHPKEALITDGVTNSALHVLARELTVFDGRDDSCSTRPISILYAHGSTLNVTKPGMVLLTTGTICYPFNRPICAYYEDMDTGCKVAAVGSTSMFEDGYVKCEDNLKFFNMVLYLLSTEIFQLNMIDAHYPDVADYSVLPSIGALADMPYACVTDTDEIPENPMSLFKFDRFNCDNSLYPKVRRACQEMGSTGSTLRMIKPKFLGPLPDLSPALLPPGFRELRRPGLELFDLDDHFAPDLALLARLTHKCTDDDLSYYVLECSKILQIPCTEAVVESRVRKILQHVLFSVSDFKKTSRAPSAASQITSAGSSCFMMSDFSMDEFLP